MMTRTWKSLSLATAVAASAAFLVLGPAPKAYGQQKGKQAKAAPGPQVGVQKVQGNVYMIWTPGGNVAVSVGDWGVMVVDTPAEGLSDAVLAEIKKLSDKPIRYVLNTSLDGTATNGPISRAGAPVTGGNLGAVAFENGATIVAHENVLARMSNVPEGQKVPNADALPTTTFNEGQKEVFFNEEPVLAIYQEAAHTDGDSVVFFRRSDVIAAGGVFDMTAYPHIDLAKGGNVQGVLKALNLILDLCVPRHEQEGGTYVIPGKGRLTDEHDVLEYRDMVTIIRDRIQDGIKKGQTLAQIKAAKPTYEYDARWGSTTGPWTTDMFIEAVYKSLGGK
jgi:glyoxylase-like metal-dependent hydrolase (beta-lactamase superfamily II)